MDNIQVMTPESLPELVEALKRSTFSTRPVAGGTDLMISLRRGKMGCDTLIDLSGVREMNFIKAEEGFISIGAGTTFTDIVKSEILHRSAISLTVASGSIGSPQIRNRATIGGNIANASPAADSIPPLLMLEAEAVIINSKGEYKTVPLEDLLVDYEKTSLNHDEVIVSIRFPEPGAGYRNAFSKIGSRKTVTIAKLSLAVGGYCSFEENRLSRVRVALGSVGKSARRFRSVETFLEGRDLSSETADLLSETLSLEVESAISGRSSMPYKREAVKALAYEVIERLIGS